METHSDHQQYEHRRQQSRNGLIRPNPALSKAFNTTEATWPTTEPMTINGTVNRTALLLVVLTFGAAAGWMLLPASLGVVAVGAVLGLILGIAAMRVPKHAAKLAPAYALVEGLVVGVISRMYETTYDGIVIQAAAATLLVLVSLLVVYRSGLIKVTQNFRLGVSAAVGGIMLLYLVDLGWILLGGTGFSFIRSTGMFGIGFSVFVVLLAAATLVIDFDFIETGVQQQLPRQYEWVAATGLLVSLVWLYLELLRLIAKLRSND